MMVAGAIFSIGMLLSYGLYLMTDEIKASLDSIAEEIRRLRQ